MARSILLAAFLLPLIAACMGGENDETPTQTPVIIVATSEPTESDSASGPTATEAAPPTATSEPTPTEEPSPTPEPSPTALPTRPPRPLPTRPSIVIPTAVPQEVDTGGVELPSDPLLILPQTELAPEGMVLSDEGPASLELAAGDAADPDARAQQLTEWGFQGGAFRDIETPDDQLTDPDNQILAIFTLALIMGSPENAQLEMHSYFDEVVLTDADLAAQEVPVDPIGDAARGATSTVGGPDGSVNFSALLVTAGPVSLKFLAISGAAFDAMPTLRRAAEISLDNLRYSGLPTLGETLLQTDFSNWFTGPLETGEITFGEDGFYHVRVDAGGGSFVSAYSIDHEPYADVAVSVDLVMISGDPTSTGCVMTRLDQEAQLFNYAFCIDGNGNLEALYEQFDAEGNYTSEPLIPFGTLAVAPPTEWTTLSIVARGQEFWFLVNDQLIDRVQHAGPAAGSVGVIVNHFAAEPQTPAEFIFTNLVVRSVQ